MNYMFNLKEILYEIVVRWRALVISMFVGIFIAIGYKYYCEKSVVNYDSELSIEEALTKEEVKEVDEIVRLQQLYDKKLEYLDDLIEYLEDKQVVMEYIVISEDSQVDSEVIMTQLCNYIRNGGIVNSIEEKNGKIDKLQDLILIKDEYSVGTPVESCFIVMIATDNYDTGMDIANLIKDDIVEYDATLKYDHKLELINLEKRSGLDLEFKNRQYIMYEELNQLKSNIEAKTAKLSGLQRSLIKYRLDEPVTVSENKIGIKEYVTNSILGAVITAGLMIIFLIIKLCLSTKIYNLEEIEILDDDIFCNEIYFPGCRNRFDVFVRKLVNSKMQEKSLQNQQKIALYQIEQQIKSCDKKELILFSIQTKRTDQFCKMVSDQVNDKKISVINSFDLDIAQYKKMVSDGAVLFVEEKGKNSLLELKDGLKTCFDSNIDILGVVLIKY